LEHVLDPSAVVAEIHRVLKPDGYVYAETPFMQQVHERAYDFSRFTRSGHRWLFRQFDEIDAGPITGPATAFLWSMRYLLRALGAGENLAPYRSCFSGSDSSIATASRRRRPMPPAACSFSDADQRAGFPRRPWWGTTNGNPDGRGILIRRLRRHLLPQREKD
jgi:hypothetical protein